jgi:hypothetical protein
MAVVRPRIMIDRKIRRLGWVFLQESTGLFGRVKDLSIQSQEELCVVTRHVDEKGPDTRIFSPNLPFVSPCKQTLYNGQIKTYETDGRPT